MRKAVFLYTICLLTVSTAVLGQGPREMKLAPATPISAWLVRGNIIPTGVSVERGVFYSTSVEFGGGLTYDGPIFTSSVGNPVFIWGNPYFNLKINQYIGRGKMERMGRPTFNNAGKYLSLDYQYTFPPIAIINDYAVLRRHVNSHRYLITYGSKVNLGPYFQMGSEAGLGVIMNAGIWPTYNVKMFIAWIITSY